MSINQKPGQRARVLKYINDFGSITQLEAIRDLGILRLASSISELRKMGYAISGRFIKVKNRYGENSSIMQYYFNETEDKAV